MAVLRMLKTCARLWLRLFKVVLYFALRCNFKLLRFFCESISTTFYAMLFTCTNPKSAKNTVKLSVFFGFLGSVQVKVVHKMLVKLTPNLYQEIFFCKELTKLQVQI